MYTPDAVISVAKNELGYYEKKSNSQLDSKTANAGSGNWTKYARDLDALTDFYNGAKNGFAWCDIFVDWCFYKAFGKAAAMKLLCQPLKSAGAGCVYSYGYYKSAGRVGRVPKLGAQIFFGNSEGSLTHTGLVTGFDSSYVYTIEGNTSDCVKAKTYNRSASNLWYGYPAYDEVDDKQTPPTPTKSIDEIVKEIIDGKWGVAMDRKTRLTSAGYNYDAVQSRVNEYYSAANKCADIVRGSKLDIETFTQIFKVVI